jgi:type IV pilus assembly protein PilV
VSASRQFVAVAIVRLESVSHRHVVARNIRRPLSGSGFSLIEVLVAIVLLSIGMLGLSALQARATLIGIESYQRTQALLLAQDMLDRIRANKPDASAYAGADFGTGPLAGCGATPGVLRDRCLWTNALAGAAETIGGQAVGTLTGGRGCVSVDAAGHVSVAVAWQGLAATVAPSTDCARDAYGTESLRRVVVVSAFLPALHE